jgi:hypothetical protein
MSFAITHFAIGAAFMTLVVGVLAPRSRLRGTAIMLSGIWALIPDLDILAPTYVERFESAYEAVPADLFWFHGIFDVIDPDESVLFAGVALAGWFGVTVAVELGGYLIAKLGKRRADRADRSYDLGD